MRNFTPAFFDEDSTLAAVPSELLVPELEAVLRDHRADTEDLGLRRLLELSDSPVRPRSNRASRRRLGRGWDEAA